MNPFNYIFTGGGASALILAYRMIHDPFFNDKSILMIESSEKNTNDRTWCFWEKGKGEWDDILEKSWDKVSFKSNIYSENLSIAPYSYKMIRSSRLYRTVLDQLRERKNITILNDQVIDIKQGKLGATVHTLNGTYQTEKVINSIPFDQSYKSQQKFSLLQQHFLGWFIETKEACFDDSQPTLMDFTVAQKDHTRFMYILPESPYRALLEYTLFSKTLLTNEEYETEIKNYLAKKGITNYTITEKEQGVIPMTAYQFWKHNSEHLINIGTAGGWSKASTGYTFMNITKRTRDLTEFLKTEKSFKKFHKTKKFWFYDLLLLDVLSKYNHFGAQIFGLLFKRNSIQQIFKFLDEETNFREDIKIMIGMPPLKFMRALIKRLFRSLYNASKISSFFQRKSFRTLVKA